MHYLSLTVIKVFELQMAMQILSLGLGKLIEDKGVSTQKYSKKSVKWLIRVSASLKRFTA